MHLGGAADALPVCLIKRNSSQQDEFQACRTFLGFSRWRLCASQLVADLLSSRRESVRRQLGVVRRQRRSRRHNKHPQPLAKTPVMDLSQTRTKRRMTRDALRILRNGTFSLLAVAIAFSAQAAGDSVIRFAMTDAPPLATATKETASGMKGLYPDILDEVLSKRMGLQWKGSLFPWKRAQMELQTGSADVIITVPSEERKAYSIPSALPVFEEYLHIYTYKDHPRISEIRKIKTVEDIQRLGLIPATNIGNNWHDENIDARGIKTRYVPADEILPGFLAAKRADIIIDTPSTMDPKINSLGLAQQIERTPARFGPIGFYILVGKRSPLSTAMNALDQSVEAFVRDGTRERLAAKHLGIAP